MRKENDILSSISRTVGVLFLVQVVFTLLTCVFFRIQPSRFGLVSYVLALALVHVGLWIFLSIMHEQFILIHTGEKLKTVNMANKITMLRISSIPTIALTLTLADTYPLFPVLVPLVFFIFLTDLLDGWVARARHQVTKIGRYLDSISDYAILIVVSVVMAYYNIASDWIIILVLFRLVFQWIGMGALLVYQGHIHANVSLLGKIAIFTTMSLYGLEVFVFTGQFSFLRPYLNILEYCLALILCLSLIEKSLYLKKSFVEAKDKRLERRDNDL